MNRIFTLAFLLLSVIVFGQAPQLIPYQAIARDEVGQPLSNTIINARFTIHDSAATGANVWQEIQTVSTSSLGLFTVQLGSANSLSNVSWASGSKFMQVEVDLGDGFVDFGTQQMLSVPYAMYALTSGNSTPSPQGPTGPQGEPGANGEDGLSAYQIWLSQGNEGTENDFLSSIDTSIWKRNLTNNSIYFPGKVGIGKINTYTTNDDPNLDVNGRYISLHINGQGDAGLVKNVPINTPGYDGKLFLGFDAFYSTIELNHVVGGYSGGPGISNFFTTFNTTEGGVSGGERMRIDPRGNVGIGTTNPQRRLHVSDAMRLEPLSAPPANPSRGDMYYDGVINRLRVFDGATWQNCW